MKSEHADALEQSLGGDASRPTCREGALLPAHAVPVAMQALREARLRGLPAAEEYRVVTDRLYRAGVRDLSPGALVRWIEESVGMHYETLLELRRLGDRVNGAIARDDLAAAAWEIICQLSPESRARLISGLLRLDALERSDH